MDGRVNMRREIKGEVDEQDKVESDDDEWNDRVTSRRRGK